MFISEDDKSEDSVDNREKKSKKRPPYTLLFWVVFVVVIALLFIICAPQIQKTVRDTHLVERMQGKGAPVDAEPEESVAERPALPASEPGMAGEWVGGQNVTSAALAFPDMAPESSTSAALAPNATQAALLAPSTPAQPSETSVPAETRQRSLYFIEVDPSGMIYTVPCTRIVPLTDSPLMDTLRLLFAGPSNAEQAQGLATLIPPGTRLLSATVKNGIVTINLSEDFMFNSYGAEGYLAQLKQLVFTATEFPSVKKVQLLIEGRRVEFLAENILIREPIGRDSL